MLGEWSDARRTFSACCFFRIRRSAIFSVCVFFPITTYHKRKVGYTTRTVATNTTYKRTVATNTTYKYTVADCKHLIWSHSCRLRTHLVETKLSHLQWKHPRHVSCTPHASHHWTCPARHMHHTTARVLHATCITQRIIELLFLGCSLASKPFEFNVDDIWEIKLKGECNTNMWLLILLLILGEILICDFWFCFWFCVSAIHLCDVKRICYMLYIYVMCDTCNVRFKRRKRFIYATLDFIRICYMWYIYATFDFVKRCMFSQDLLYVIH